MDVSRVYRTLAMPVLVGAALFVVCERRSECCRERQLTRGPFGARSEPPDLCVFREDLNSTADAPRIFGKRNRGVWDPIVEKKAIGQFARKQIVGRLSLRETQEGVPDDPLSFQTTVTVTEIM